MFELPALPYAYNALEPYIDEETMRIHHDKHHAAYVKNLNDALAVAMAEHPECGAADMTIEKVLTCSDTLPDNIKTKIKNNGGGHANHTMFWETMSANTSGHVRQPEGELAAAIKKEFGDFPTFQKQFSAAAMGRFGSGWAWLVVKDGALSVMDTPNQDNPILSGAVPILGLDVWEHAYYLKYQNMRADYIAQWWYVVDWTSVQKRFSGK